MNSIIVLAQGILALVVTQFPLITHVDSSTPRQDQLRIAKLAAPRAVGDRADIYVLGDHGYELAVRGDNGFSCLIEREKPDTMEPVCYDAEGSQTTLRRGSMSSNCAPTRSTRS